MASAASVAASKVVAAPALARSSSSSLSPYVPWALGGWVFFVAENAILSENRTYLIEKLGGDDNYHYVYGTISTIATAPILYSYRKLPMNTVPVVSNLQRGLAGIVTSVGLILASQALPKLQIPFELVSTTAGSSNPNNNNTSSLPTSQHPAAAANTMTTESSSSSMFKVRCPFDFSDNNNHQQQTTNTAVVVSGMDRVSRHTGLWSLALVFAGNACLQTHPARALYMLGPTLVASVGGYHADSRFRRNMGGTMDPEYDRLTSHIPFVAMIGGQQGPDAFYTWWTHEVKHLNALLATIVAWTYVGLAASRGGRGGSTAASRMAATAMARKK